MMSRAFAANAAPVVDAGAAPLVLFDFDGVLLKGDAFNLFIRERLRRGWWRLVPGIPLLPVLAVLACWRRGRLTAGRLVVRVALLGFGERRYQARVDRFADTLVRKSRRVSRAGVARFRAHLRAGARVVIVSGCEERLLRAILAGLGITGVEVIATQVAWRFPGMRVAWQNVGPRKLESLARRGIARCEVAYSDSLHDLPMLALAREPVLVNATPRACKRAERVLGRTVARVAWD